MPKNTVKIKTADYSLESVLQLWGWILLFWSLYRYFLTLPEWVDELIFKPLIFILPVLIYVVKKEKQKFASVGITNKNIFTQIYIGLGFGFLFAMEGIIANTLKYGKLSIIPIDAFKQTGLFSLLGLSLATAFSEELLNRGFIFNRIYEKTQRLVYAMGLSTTLFIFLHIPILVTTNKLQGTLLLLYFLSNACLSLINCYLFYRSKSLVAPILVHVFWNMTLALYL
jgi:uncharacterized protein